MTITKNADDYHKIVYDTSSPNLDSLYINLPLHGLTTEPIPSITIQAATTMMANGNYSINNSGTIGGAGTIYGTGTYPYGNITAQNPINQTFDVKGDANFEGDVKIKGQSILELLEKIESRLAILQPDPAKLEKYEALRKAYNHYKLLEKLVGDD